MFIPQLEKKSKVWLGIKSFPYTLDSCFSFDTNELKRRSKSLNLHIKSNGVQKNAMAIKMPRSICS